MAWLPIGLALFAGACSNVLPAVHPLPADMQTWPLDSAVAGADAGLADSDVEPDSVGEVPAKEEDAQQLEAQPMEIRLGRACTPGDCDDGNGCTDDTCNAITYQCQHLPNLLPCSDGDNCTQGDTCNASVCKSGQLLDADGDGFAPKSCGGFDCNDSNGAVNPGQAEGCTATGVDDNCDGATDEGCACSLSGFVWPACAVCMKNFVLTGTNLGSVCAPDAPTWGIPDAGPTGWTDNGDGTVSDGFTNLMWQQKVSGNPMTWANAQSFCKTQSTGAYSNWRIPTVAELESTIDFTKASPAVMTALAVSPTDVLWTSVPCSGASGWFVNFAHGDSSFVCGIAEFRVRCVRQESAKPPIVRFVVQAQGATVYDAWTQRTWQRTVPVGTYSAVEAMNYCAGLLLAGGGWHLPDIRELRSIVDRQQGALAIDPSAFPDTPADWFWSKTPWIGDGGNWLVVFADGISFGQAKFAAHRVRCVR